MKLHRAGWSWFASTALAATAFACALATPTALRAQAFGLNEIGSCALARSFATAAAPCKDASSLFWNPGFGTKLPGWTVAAGVAAIGIDGSFTQDTTFRKWDADVPTQWVPHVFVNYHKPTSKLAYGLGVYVPYGLTSQWTDDFPGRFSAKKASLATIYTQPTIAYQLNKDWSIGGGPIWAHSTVELIQAVDLSSQQIPNGPTFGQIGVPTGTEFARARLKGSGGGFGAQIGLYGKVDKDWTFGARFLTKVKVDYDGADAQFTQVPTGLVLGTALSPQLPAGTPIDAIVAPQFQSGGALVPQNASTTIHHPAQVQAGFAYSGFKNWVLEGDYAWLGWKTFKELPVIFDGPAASQNRVLLEDYNNSSSVRLGAEYTIPTDGWKLRAGFAGASSAAPDITVTPLLPEQDRTYWTAGIGLPTWKYFSADVAYAYIHTGGKRGRIVERTNTENTNATAEQLNSGVYHLSGNIVSVTLKASF